MLRKSEIEKIIHEDLKKVLPNKNIFKYVDFDTGVNKILLGQTLNFTHPDVFNDPFDCNEKLLKVITPKEELKKIFDRVKRTTPIKFHEQIWKDINDPRKVEEFNKTEKDKHLISCFSELNNEVLMWSHYGEKHKGICIGFDFPHTYKNKFIIHPVKYETKLKPLDGTCSISRLILYWLTTKSKRWSYEKEIRAIRQTTEKQKFEILEYDKEYIKEVIFGCNVTQKKIYETFAHIQNSNLNINNILFKKMEIDCDTFLLKEKIIKPMHNKHK